MIYCITHEAEKVRYSLFTQKIFQLVIRNIKGPRICDPFIFLIPVVCTCKQTLCNPYYISASIVTQ